jgi:hypothetical protein
MPAHNQATQHHTLNFMACMTPQPHEGNANTSSDHQQCICIALGCCPMSCWHAVAPASLARSHTTYLTQHTTSECTCLCYAMHRLKHSCQNKSSNERRTCWTASFSCRCRRRHRPCASAPSHDSSASQRAPQTPHAQPQDQPAGQHSQHDQGFMSGSVPEPNQGCQSMWTVGSLPPSGKRFFLALALGLSTTQRWKHCLVMRRYRITGTCRKK